ncbi:MAG: aldo/keto reductase [Anaerolineales bacterium]
MSSPAIPDSVRFLHAVEIGLGAWQWGDRFIWQFGHGYDENEIRQAFLTAVQEGVRFIDTAEVYGNGRSERLLGTFLKEIEEPILVATKFMPFPWRLSRRSLLRSLRHSLERMGLKQVDLYQIHWPFPPVPIETWMDAMAEAVEQGLTRAVGVSNYNLSQMMQAYAALQRHGLTLASNQVKYSLLDRRVEKDGLLARCKELGVRLIAYSPLEMGLLTGKYGPQNPPPGVRGARYRRLLALLPPLIERLTEIGREHAGRSPAQVALNWLICKGALPIPGAKNAKQAAQNAGAAGWRLSEAEVAELDELSDSIARALEK